MPSPYSLDLRNSVAGFLGRGYSCRAAAATFGISIATAVRIGQRSRQTGSAAAKPMGGVRRDALAQQRDWLRARIAEVPDLTLCALRAELAERGLTVSRWTIWKFCRTEKLTVKKKPSAQRAGAPRHRTAADHLATADGAAAAVATGLCG
jgi:transposase